MVLAQAAEAAGVSDRTAAKWRHRYHQEGPAGMADRPSVPARQPAPTAALRRVRLTAARRSRWC